MAANSYARALSVPPAVAGGSQLRHQDPPATAGGTDFSFGRRWREGFVSNGIYTSGNLFALLLPYI